MWMTARRRAWLLKVALVEVGLWIARSDGSVSREEASELLSALREWGTSTWELEQLKTVGRRVVTSRERPATSLRNLTMLLSPEQRPVFLEYLARIAFSAQPRCSAKLGRLLDVARAMHMEQERALALVERIIGSVGSTEALRDPIDDLHSAMAELGIDTPDPVLAKRAYRRLTFQHHPDRHPEATEAQREALVTRLVRIRRAYEIIEASMSRRSVA